MASRASVRTFQGVTKPIRQRCLCQNNSSATAMSLSSTKQFSTSTSRASEQQQSETGEKPRWAYTPSQMIAPFHPRTKDPRKAYTVNEDPALLDQAYERFLGKNGSKVLTDEIKWLAVTHKSFDQGRRGFNDRLAFFGRRILQLQTSLTLLHSSVATQTQGQRTERAPFEHPALKGLENLNDVKVLDVLSKERLGGLAKSCGLAEATRWKPKNPRNMRGSGEDVILSSTIFAIIGAIALQRGGDVAASYSRSRILKPLGIS